MRRTAVAWTLALAVIVAPRAGDAAEGDPMRGAYLFAIAGCAGCHTPKAELKTGPVGAGGRAITSPYGTFYSPNITSDKTTGIGAWTLADFRRALHEGRGPDGQAYFPAFPFTSYTAMTDADVRDLWAYTRTLPAVPRANREHAVGAPFGWRLSARLWQAMFFQPSRFQPAPERTAEENRGAYLVDVLGHCGECHTPRGRLGNVNTSRHLAGTPAGPHGEAIPNITPDRETGIGKWSAGDLKALFTIGMLPDADFVGSGMALVVDKATAHWTEADRQAAIAYLQSLPAIRNDLLKKKKKTRADDEWN